MESVRWSVKNISLLHAESGALRGGSAGRVVGSAHGTGQGSSHQLRKIILCRVWPSGVWKSKSYTAGGWAEGELPVSFFEGTSGRKSKSYTGGGGWTDKKRKCLVQQFPIESKFHTLQPAGKGSARGCEQLCPVVWRGVAREVHPARQANLPCCILLPAQLPSCAAACLPVARSPPLHPSPWRRPPAARPPP